jgi:hypothetical protein
LPDDDQQRGEQPTALTQDTVADKAVRFGCGVGLGGLIVVALVLFGLGEPFGMAGVIIGGVIFVGACAGLSVAYGEPFIRSLLKLMEWI